MNKSFDKYLKLYFLTVVFIPLFILSIYYLIFDDHIFLNKIIYKFVDKHIVNVETDSNVDLNEVSIKWTSSKGEKFIYKNGKKVNKVGYFYGDYGFSIYYKDSLIDHFGHLNSEWNNINHYIFKIYNNNNTITSSLMVVGPDSISKLYWHEIYHPYTQDKSKVQKCELSNSLRENNQKNLVEINMNPEDYSKIEDNINSKFPMKKAKIRINNDLLQLRKIKIAGASTLQYRRKSYKISLEKPYLFKDKDSTIHVQNFRLLGLSMDSYYYNMFISYCFMKELNLFNLYFTYVELKINNETQGLYLLIEEPEHYALEREKSNFIIRRNYNFSSFLVGIKNNEFEYKSELKNSPLTDADYITSFKSIYKNLYKYHGKELYNELNKLINFNQYTKWMAVNYFLLNGDYTDEVFFYSKFPKARFEIIPWDYDDILRLPPHEGWDYRHSKIGNKLIYSIEDSLDLKIANDEYLYAQYLNSLDLLIKTLDEKLIKKVFEDACNNIRQYIKNQDILAMSRYDKTPIIDENDFITNLKATYIFLIDRRKNIYDKLHNMNNLVEIQDSMSLKNDRLTLQNNAYKPQ